MHYKINVSLNGIHYFATSDHSLNDEKKARDLLAVFLEKFPPSDGYRIELSVWVNKGK